MVIFKKVFKEFQKTSIPQPKEEISKGLQTEQKDEVSVSSLEEKTEPTTENQDTSKKASEPISVRKGK